MKLIMLITGKQYYFSPAKKDYGVFVGYDKEDDETILIFTPIVNTTGYAIYNGDVLFTSDGNDSNFILVEVKLSINNPNTTQQRIKSLPLSLPEMLYAVSVMNKLANNSGATRAEYELLQRMLHEYENLKHYKACNGCNVEYEVVESKINRNETA